MKKIFGVLGVMVAIAVLVSGVTVAYAKGNDNGNGNGNSVQQRTQLCDQLLLGTIMQTAGNASGGTITLLPQGNDTTVNITVNPDTKYRAWLKPNQEVSFGDLKYGDWVGVCADNNVARLVVKLQVPEKPFQLKLEGNVTNVNGNIITGNIKGGGTFTVDLTGVSGNFTGAAGQPIELNIGKNTPPAWGLFQELTTRNFTAGIGVWMKNHGWTMGR